MITGIRRFFEDRLTARDDEPEQDRRHRLQLASAALLMELINTDRHVDAREEEAFAAVLRSSFGLDREALREITRLAHEESTEATSIYQFTSLVNEGYGHDDKLQLIENMWRVAMADGSLDKYEEQLIRKTADLIYVPHSDFIRCKLKVRDELQQD